MNCHLLTFLMFCGFSAVLVVGIAGVAWLCDFLQRRIGIWASWTFLGGMGLTFMAAVAWHVPCPQ